MYEPINEFDFVHPIVMEASSANERAYMRKAGKNEVHQINGALINTLYKDTVARNNCDFGEIPKSNGNITKLKIYKPTRECLDVLATLFTKNGIREPKLDVVKNAMRTVESYIVQFELGFRMNQEFVILLYNTTVMAIVDATSMLIATYMDFIIGPDQEKYTPTGRFDKGRGEVSIENLVKFNSLEANGKLREALTKSVYGGNGRSNFTGTEVVLVMTALMAIIPLCRELIFFYNRYKLRISDYLDQEVQFLEMHELAIKSSRTKTSAEKREILEKQRKIMTSLRHFRDRMKIQNENAEDSMRKEVKQDNSMYTLSNIENISAQNKLNGDISIQFF